MWVQLYEISNLLKTWETFEVYVYSGDTAGILLRKQHS